MEIRVHYRTLDGVSKARTFKTLKGARKFAQTWVGKTPEIGTRYAVSGDGMGKVTVRGATLEELFAPEAAETVTTLDAEAEAEAREWAECAEAERQAWSNKFEYDAEAQAELDREMF